MDALSNDLHLCLTQLGSDPKRYGDTMTEYLKRLLHLLNPDDEQLVISHYGLFGHQATSLATLAQTRHIDEDALRNTLTSSLRKIAVTPEWQMLLPMTKLKAIKLK